jgi:hypothetical protein
MRCHRFGVGICSSHYFGWNADNARAYAGSHEVEKIMGARRDFLLLVTLAGRGGDPGMGSIGGARDGRYAECRIYTGYVRHMGPCISHRGPGAAGIRPRPSDTGRAGTA